MYITLNLNCQRAKEHGHESDEKDDFATCRIPGLLGFARNRGSNDETTVADWFGEF